MQKISPCLWFDDHAEEAARFYVSVFKNSKILSVARYGEAAAKASGKPQGSVLTVAFQLEGQDFLALNAGPGCTFSPAVSLIVKCRTQKEIDELWKKLSADENAGQCGWLRDKYGVSWQIVPAALGKLVAGKDAEKSNRVMKALVQMKKLDLKALQEA